VIGHRHLAALCGLVLAGVVALAAPAPAGALPDLTDSACALPGVSLACDAASAGARGAAGTVADGVLGVFKDAVVDAAVWGVTEAAKAVDQTTRVDLGAQFFAAHYRFMVGAGALFVLPALLMVVAQGVLRRDGGLITRAFFGYLPASVLLTGIAVAVIQAFLAVTDALSARLVGEQRQVGDQISDGLPDALGATTIPVMLAMFVGFVLMAASVAVWLELLVRAAAIQIAVMFLPLFLAGLVWPTTARYARRLAEILGALIVSKLVVTGILSLAIAAIASGDLTAVLSGTAMFVLAAFAPFIVLSLIPIATDAGHLSQARRSASASPVRALGSQASGGTLVWQAARTRISHGHGLASPASRARPGALEGARLPVARTRREAGGK